MNEKCTKNGYTPFENQVQEAIKDLVPLVTAQTISTRVGSLYRAAIEQAQNKGGWKAGDTAPKDGTPFYARFLTPMRFKLYSPKSQEFKRGTKGRWQAMNEYGGWDNCGYGPSDWISHADYHAKTSSVTREG